MQISRNLLCPYQRYMMPNRVETLYIPWQKYSRAFYKNDLATDMDIMDEPIFARFEFKMSYGGISYIVTPPPVYI